jgi:hypothetical protein
LPLPIDKNCAFFVPAVSNFSKNNLTFSNILETKKANEVRQQPEIIGFLNLPILDFESVGRRLSVREIRLRRIRILPGVPVISRGYGLMTVTLFFVM